MKNTRVSAMVRAMLVGLVFAAGVLGMAQEKAAKKTPEAKQEQAQVKSNAININKADVEELDKLPRVGPAIARRIIAFREEHGGFKKLEELMNVSGIGPKTFERLKDQISL